LFSGLTGLTQKPDALFVIDPKREHIAVSEAQKIGIPVIALANTDTNLAGLTYPIVGNDGSVSSISLVMERAVAAWRSGSASSQSL
jgi:small subunit ribosomal protein S2